MSREMIKLINFLIIMLVLIIKPIHGVGRIIHPLEVQIIRNAVSQSQPMFVIPMEC